MKILFMSTSNISILGGDTLQLVSDMNMWNIENEVYYISANKLFNSAVIENLNEEVNMFFPTVANGIEEFYFTPSGLIEQMKKMDEKENFDLVFCRGSKLIKTFLEEEEEIFKTKALIYMTDTETLSKKENKKIFQNAYILRGQSLKFKEKIEKEYNIEIKRFLEQPPMIEEFNLPKEKLQYDIIYTGKIGEGWGILEYLQFLERNPLIEGAIVYSRIVNNFTNPEEKVEIVRLLNELPNLKVFVGLSREESLQLLMQSKLSYCYRSEQIDNDESFEISTKLIECLNLEIPIILRKTKLHTTILEEEYPLFGNSTDEMEHKILEFLKGNLTTKSYKEKSFKYTTKEVYKNTIEIVRRFKNDE